jgi:murein DD-endopeptidase MepM/ murein hydrolase activator NlpD
LFLLFITISGINAYELYDNKVESKVWKSGETLLGFLQENMLPLKLYYDMDGDDEKLASEIRVSSICYILRDEEYEIKQALISLNEELQLHILRDLNGSYSMSVEPVLYQEKEMTLNVALDDVFSKSVVKYSDNFLLAIELEQMFKGSIDFTRLKLGDKVIAFYTQKRRLGKFYGSQVVKAAMIKNRKKSYYQFLAEDDSYYDSNGKKAIGNSFMVPCRYRRISSKFTKKRWHPILKRYRAHHGIDYAGPTGTPIKAAYDGQVIFMGRKGGYGKTIVIRHKGGYKTLYAHLSRYNNSVRRKRVKKGRVIGYMGSTGRSTGPHLHFGLSLRGRWINPAKKVVIKSGLTGSKKTAFNKIVKKYKTKFKRLVDQND